MIEHDPDAFEDFIEDSLTETCEEVVIDDNIVEDMDDDSVDDGVIEDAIIAGTVFGLGVEEGKEESDKRKSEDKPKRISASEYLRGKEKKKKKLRPFEQWVEDFISGKKDIEDGL